MMMKPLNESELALALTGEQRPRVPTWQEIAENQMRIIEDLSRRNNELHAVITRLLAHRVWWRCPIVSYAEH